MSVTTGVSAGGQRLDQREAAAFAMTAEHEQVCGTHQRFDSRVRHAAEQVHTLAQRRVARNARFDSIAQRRRAKTAPQLQVRQLRARRATASSTVSGSLLASRCPTHNTGGITVEPAGRARGERSPGENRLVDSGISKTAVCAPADRGAERKRLLGARRS